MVGMADDLLLQLKQARQAVEHARQQAQQHITSIHSTTNQGIDRFQRNTNRQMLRGHARKTMAACVARWRQLPDRNRRVMARLQRGVQKWRWRVAWQAFGAWQALMRMSLREEEVRLQEELDSVAQHIEAVQSGGAPPLRQKKSDDETDSEKRSRNAEIVQAVRSEVARREAAETRCRELEAELVAAERDIAAELRVRVQLIGHL